MRLREAGRLRILDFDIERRPLAYLGADYTTGEVTAICCSWHDQDRLHTWLLGRHDPRRMLAGFVRMFNTADMVTGHNIRRYDLRALNGQLLEYGLPPLQPKRLQDTYADLYPREGVSASQESLAAMLGLSAPKVGMGQAHWREANRLTPDGIAKTRLRVEGDVVQHKQLREALLERRWLRPPRMWQP